jgi:hypothetical protein
MRFSDARSRTTLPATNHRPRRCGTNDSPKTLNHFAHFRNAGGKCPQFRPERSGLCHRSMSFVVIPRILHGAFIAHFDADQFGVELRYHRTAQFAHADRACQIAHKLLRHLILKNDRARPGHPLFTSRNLLHERPKPSGARINHQRLPGCAGTRSPRFPLQPRRPVSADQPRGHRWK